MTPPIHKTSTQTTSTSSTTLKQPNRRSTLKSIGGAIAIPLFLPRSYLAGAAEVAPSEVIRVGAIGVGNRGRHLIEQLPAPGKVVAVADCNRSRAESYTADRKADWDIEDDYRHILDRKDIDAVIIATGDFQRVLPCIHACDAGKDIYAEKPLTLYIAEGRALVNRVRAKGRVFQVGTQQRTMQANKVACQYVRQGGLGKIREVRAVNYTNANASPDSMFPEQTIPPGLDWNMWLSQAAQRPFNQRWLGWMGWQDFSGGEMTNWGAHGVDQIQWALGKDGTGPVKIKPLTEGPNGQVQMLYADGTPINFVIDPGTGPNGGAIFIGEKGKLEINRNKFTSNPIEISEELNKQFDPSEEDQKWNDPKAMWQARWHLENWLDCIQSRKLPNADVEIGHRSISVCHLANIARRIGRALEWDPASEQFVGDAAANDLVQRQRRSGFELPT